MLSWIKNKWIRKPLLFCDCDGLSTSRNVGCTSVTSIFKALCKGVLPVVAVLWSQPASVRGQNYNNCTAIRHRRRKLSNQCEMTHARTTRSPFSASGFVETVKATRACSFTVNLSEFLYLRINPVPNCTAPCGLRGCKNWPALFHGRMSYKATKPGLIYVLYLSIHYTVSLFIRAPFVY